jgi:hypothetical protein
MSKNLLDEHYKIGNRLHYFCKNLDDFPAPKTKVLELCNETEANLIGSLCEDGLHRPVLDFDIPSSYHPSSTPGHAHLYIDKPLKWDDYVKLLKVMAEVGILEEAYVEHSIRQKMTFVRPPWVQKKISRDELSKMASKLPTAEEMRRKYQYQNVIFVDKK